MESDRSREDEWFLKNEKELREAAHAAREKRERERAARESEEQRQQLKQLHFMKCPKCGHDLEERAIEGITIDVCTFCEGVFFDAGELDDLFQKRDDQRKGVLRKLLGF